MMELTALNVMTILGDVLFTEDEAAEIGSACYGVDEVMEMDDPPFLMAQGIVHNFAYHPGRLRAHEHEIEDMLSQLSADFRQTGGGGMSFMQGAVRMDGEQWGEQRDVEALLCMGIALGYAGYLLPKDVWPALPGGVPYVVIYDQKFTSTT